jgi:hypothetical protein
VSELQKPDPAPKLSAHRYFTRSDEGYWEEVSLLEVDPKEIFLDIRIHESEDPELGPRAMISTLSFRQRGVEPCELHPDYGPSVPVRDRTVIIDGNVTHLPSRRRPRFPNALDTAYDCGPVRRIKLLPVTDEDGCIQTQNEDYWYSRPTVLDAETAEEIEWIALRLRWTIGGLKGTMDLLDKTKPLEPNTPVAILRQRVLVV